jgi:predicted transcriptional regulator
MAKDKEREVARKLFIELNRSQKDIALDLGLTEKTVGIWVKEGNWKSERTALVNNTQNRAEKFKAVLEDLADEQLMISQKIKDAEAVGDFKEAAVLRKTATSIADQVGKFQKALEKLDKDFKISLSTRLEIVAELFESMQDYDKSLYVSSLDFQRYYIQSIAK